MKPKLMPVIPSIVALLFFAGCCQPDPSSSFVHTVDALRHQETNNWCWAAVTQMLAGHLGLPNPPQCALANHKFSKTNCCQGQNQAATCKAEQQSVDQLLDTIHSREPTNDMSPSDAAKAQRDVAPLKAQLLRAQAILARCRQGQCPKTDDCNTPGWLELDFVGAKASVTTAALSWNSIKSQISCGLNQMAYGYGTLGAVGHVVVINGYVTFEGTDYVQLYDPAAACFGTIRLITYAEYADPAGPATHWDTWFNIAKK